MVIDIGGSPRQRRRGHDRDIARIRISGGDGKAEQCPFADRPVADRGLVGRLVDIGQIDGQCGNTTCAQIIGSLCLQVKGGGGFEIQGGRIGDRDGATGGIDRKDAAGIPQDPHN